MPGASPLPITREGVPWQRPWCCPVGAARDRIVGGSVGEEERRARIAANESVFRHVNEKIDDLNRSVMAAVSDRELSVVCECGDLSCAELIRVDTAVYERVRSEPTFFIVASGHAIDDVEEIVTRHDGFDVVCKNKGAGKAVADATDPRS